MNDRHELILTMLLLLGFALIGVGLLVVGGGIGVALSGMGLLCLGLARLGLATIATPNAALQFLLHRNVVWLLVIFFGVLPFATWLSELGLRWWERLILVGLLAWLIIFLGDRLSQVLARYSRR